MSTFDAHVSNMRDPWCQVRGVALLEAGESMTLAELAYRFERARRSVRAVFDESGWSAGSTLRSALDGRHAADFADLGSVIALQEEPDRLCYALYGLHTAGSRYGEDDSLNGVEGTEGDQE